MDLNNPGLSPSGILQDSAEFRQSKGIGNEVLPQFGSDVTRSGMPNCDLQIWRLVASLVR